MSKFFINYTRYLLILIAVIAIAEYAVVMIFDITGLEDLLTQEAEAVADSLLLLCLSSVPIYLWIIKPINKMAIEYREELENLVKAIEGSGDSVVITDSSGAIKYANRAFLKITGYTEEEVLGNNPRILQSGRQSLDFYKMMWDSIVKTGEWRGEIWNKRKNGEIYLQILHIKSILYDGVVKFYIGNGTDITDIRNQEELLRKSQKMEALGTLVGGVAHNFNNMLAGISGQAYLVRRNSNELETIKRIRTIESISRDAAHIVSQLLSFSHESIQAKKNVPIIHVLKEATETAQLGISEDIELTTDFTDELLMVYCDSVEIQQMLINLISNARDAMTTELPRKISILAEKMLWEECPKKDICLICSGHMVRIVIEDTGSGIQKTDLDNIFDPFFTTKEVGKGTGLGLSMTKGVVESHGGSIHVSSIVGVGSKFEICLPLSHNMGVGKEKSLKVIPAKMCTSILVIDDDEIVRSTLSQLLSSLGYKVVVAENGETGVLNLAKHNDISLIISDIVMPVMDGPTAVKIMRESRPELPAIFITSYDSDKITMLDDIRDESTKVITKPFNIKKLSYKIDKLLYPEEVEK